jgi:hypothetical protein
MLVFRRGKWHEIELPFSDPMLTETHRAAAAAEVVNRLVKGASFSVAVAAAEKAMYHAILRCNDRRLRIPREEHDAPQNEEK